MHIGRARYKTMYIVRILYRRVTQRFTYKLANRGLARLCIIEICIVTYIAGEGEKVFIAVCIRNNKHLIPLYKAVTSIMGVGGRDLQILKWDHGGGLGGRGGCGFRSFTQ
jgi:hypothetical protein